MGVDNESDICAITVDCCVNSEFGRRLDLARPGQISDLHCHKIRRLQILIGDSARCNDELVVGDTSRYIAIRTGNQRLSLHAKTCFDHLLTCFLVIDKHRTLLR